MATARSLIDTNWVAPAIFASVTAALVVLALYLALWATLEESYLRTLGYVLSALSVAFAAALGYETAAVATSGFPTISQVVNAAFTSSPITWVVLFGALMLVVGILATVFTRVAQSSSRVVAIQRRLDGPMPPLAWAAALAAGIVVASIVITRSSSPVAGPGFSWWVLYAGGAAFGVGALTAWALDLRPGELSARMATIPGVLRPSRPPRPGVAAAAARRVVGSHRASIGVFALAALALAAFAVFIVAWGAIRGGYLAPLCYALGVMSAAAVAALGYQVAALAGGGAHTIGDIADAAFTTHALSWVAAFGVLLFGVGLLATHFTRAARPGTAVVAAEVAAVTATSPAVWAVLVGVVVLLAATLVNRTTPAIAHATEGYSLVSWWVLYTGAALYGVGAYVAWATNWAP
jgi:hypothetical protein